MSNHQHHDTHQVTERQNTVNVYDASCIIVCF